MHEASLRIERFANIDRVLLPEASEVMPRSTISFERKGDVLIIHIKAEDTAALQSTLSSYLRYISAAMSAKEAMEE